MKITFSLLLFFIISSCSSYVQSIHSQIDAENRAKMARYRRAYTKKQRTIQNPVTLNGGVTANSQSNLLPKVTRNYTSQGTRRYKANDLVDNSNDGSLWSGKNSESFLFVNSSLKRKGDIVIVEVMKKLKGNIQDELKRNFPEKKARKKKANNKKEGADADKTAEAAAAPSPNQQEPANKVYDKISTSVVEQVNQDYILIRGRKEVLYKNFKRYFEFQAIVSQKDVSNRDTVSSNKLLEPKINVLRY